MADNVAAKIRGQVMGILEEIRKAEAITQARIAQVLDSVCLMFPALPEDFDRQAMLASIEEKISIWIGEERELVNDEGHVEWLAARKPDITWSYWERYRSLMLPQIGLDPVTKLDGITDRILSHIEDPTRDGAWDRRGLIVGHVQSGKTANYTGLITKAADAGYKIIIVLAGIHNNLRSQTQIRIEEGFLGYDNDRVEGEGFRPVGVGLIDPDPKLRPDCVTNRADNGDFNTNRARTFSINPGGRPLVFVIKKQRTVLRNLIDWVKWAHTAVDRDTGREFVTGIPLLVIDDEADHASVDTKDGAFDADGNPDPEHDPSKINQLIRKLLSLFEQKAYVGYTATPFANIFIHEQAETAEEGPDLFPGSFILSLPAPSDYFGPVHVFGTGFEEDDETVDHSEHRYVREIDDHADSLDLDERSGWVPPKHRNGHVPRYLGELVLPPSLVRALQSFAIATGIRRARGQTAEHNSMLVHVSRFTSVQNLVKDQIEAEVHAMQREFRYGEVDGERSICKELATLFKTDFEFALRLDYNPDGGVLTWKDIEPHVAVAVTQLDVREINGTAGDILDQESAGSEHVPTIAVGGDKLSRGLTLKGLTTSYFLRASRMYDTLMQMGRWFGYRRGYEDVCRLFMTSDLREWFEKITIASEELREEFDHMAAVRGTPRNYGLRVRSHPALMITSRVKMRSGTPMKLSFAGTISETIVFHASEDVIKANRDAVDSLLLAAGRYDADPRRKRPGGSEHSWMGSYLWGDVDGAKILSFLSGYATHQDSVKANSNFLRQYIEKQLEKGDLERWDVALLSGRSKDKADLGGISVPMIQRTALERNISVQQQKDAGKYVIGRLVSPRDEAIDLHEDDFARALERTQSAWHDDAGRNRAKGDLPEEPSGMSIREVRSQCRGLLLLYPLDPTNGVTDGIKWPIMAMALSFPTSSGATAIDYVVNNVFARSENEL